jgi:hypothetical protein
MADDPKAAAPRTAPELPADFVEKFPEAEQRQTTPNEDWKDMIQFDRAAREAWAKSMLFGDGSEGAAARGAPKPVMTSFGRAGATPTSAPPPELPVIMPPQPPPEKENE